MATNDNTPLAPKSLDKVSERLKARYNEILAARGAEDVRWHGMILSAQLREGKQFSLEALVGVKASTVNPCQEDGCGEPGEIVCFTEEEMQEMDNGAHKQDLVHGLLRGLGVILCEKHKQHVMEGGLVGGGNEG
jgi:hypothetical protein